MAIRGYNESGLSSSEIFAGLSTLSSNDPKAQAIGLIKSLKPLTVSEIEGAYVMIKNYPNMLSRAAIKAFDEGKTVLLFNDNPTLAVTHALPFITFNTPRGYTTYIFLDRYASKTRDGILNINGPMLHDLLVGALISNRLKEVPERVSTNQFLQILFTDIYAQLVGRVLNRLFSINPDLNVRDTSQFWIRRFFLQRVFGSRESLESTNILAGKNIKSLDEMRLNEIKMIYAENPPQQISELLELIKPLSPRMKTLSLGTFIEDWIKYYYPPALLAIDNLEYFIFMIILLKNGNSAVNISAGEIVKEARNIKSLNEELYKLI